MSGRAITYIIKAESLVQAGVDKAVRALRGMRASLSNVFAGSSAGIGGLARFGLQMQGIHYIARGLSFAFHQVQTAVSAAFQFERYRMQMSVLLGSVDAAQARIKELHAFAAATPFEMPEIVDASRLLEVLTNGLMGSRASLELVGDAAAITGNQINEVAMWVGRAYTAIRSGREFGIAARRLQEMGILSGEARNRMEELQDSGAAAADVWRELNDALMRFSGSMKIASQTGEGLVSTLRDELHLAYADFGEGMVQATKDAMREMIAEIAKQRDAGTFHKAGENMGFVAEGAGRLGMGALGAYNRTVDSMAETFAMQAAILKGPQAAKDQAAIIRGSRRTPEQEESIAAAAAASRLAAETDIENQKKRELLRIQEALNQAEKDRIDKARQGLRDLVAEDATNQDVIDRLKRESAAKEATLLQQRDSEAAKAYQNALNQGKSLDEAAQARDKTAAEYARRAAGAGTSSAQGLENLLKDAQEANEKRRTSARDDAAKLDERRQAMQDKINDLRQRGMSPDEQRAVLQQGIYAKSGAMQAERDPTRQGELAGEILDMLGRMEGLRDKGLGSGLQDYFLAVYGQQRRRENRKLEDNTERMVGLLEKIAGKPGGMAP
jgi:hypothetical protein